MKPLTITVQTAYAELLEQLLALDAHRSIGHAPGAFVTKTLKERPYYYFQYSTPGGTTRQAYIGPKSDALDAVVARFATERAALRDESRAARRARCRASRRRGRGDRRCVGAHPRRAGGRRRLQARWRGRRDACVLLALGNLLGVSWDGASARTEDVDIAAPRVLELAVPTLDADIPRAIETLEMGFLPVPAFSPKDASTSFKVRGRGLRVDLVTPGDGARAERPVHIGRFNAAAAPVRYLELVLDDTQPAAIVNGGGVLVTVPHPARFAVLKLLVAQDRPSAFQAKSDKDVAQAVQLMEALEQLRPGDLRTAWRAAARRGKRWSTALGRGVKLVRRRAPDLADRLEKLGAR